MTFKQRTYQIIFEADTPLGKLFDVVLIGIIGFSLLAVCLESVASYKVKFQQLFTFSEILFTSFFTIEYLFRLYCVERKRDYLFSFYGVIDLLAILPSYIGLYFIGVESLMVIRAVRLLRIFRLFKLTHYIGESEVLVNALKASRHKITVFIFTVFTVVLFVGALMYVIEGDENGFSSIPKAMYWAIVTMTTVGYGDIVPLTDLGRTLAAFLMVMGYGIIAVPTGIVTTELASAGIDYKKEKSQKDCRKCSENSEKKDAHFCENCGKQLV